jgi:hypothetical protein
MGRRSALGSAFGVNRRALVVLAKPSPTSSRMSSRSMSSRSMTTRPIPIPLLPSQIQNSRSLTGLAPSTQCLSFVTRACHHTPATTPPPLPAFSQSPNAPRCSRAVPPALARRPLTAARTPQFSRRPPRRPSIAPVRAASTAHGAGASAQGGPNLTPRGCVGIAAARGGEANGLAPMGTGEGSPWTIARNCMTCGQDQDSLDFF